MSDDTIYPASMYPGGSEEDFAKLRNALKRIAALDPEKDSEDGYNEWGEADCFRQAQAIAKEAL